MGRMNARVRTCVLALAALCGVALTVSLGLWQLDRARQKQALHAAVQQGARMAPLDAAALGSRPLPEGFAHRPVDLSGVWLPEHTVYLDNRQMGGRQGFFVMTPLKLEGTSSAVLVQRGWAPRHFQDRQSLPPVLTPSGTVRVTGRLATAPARLYEFEPTTGGRIRQNLDVAAFRAETALPLIDAIVVQSAGASEGLLRDWPAFDAGVDKHHGYAVQWFGLATLIACLYVWFQFIQPYRRARAQH